jgi:hypothetical protein
MISFIYSSLTETVAAGCLDFLPALIVFTNGVGLPLSLSKRLPVWGSCREVLRPTVATNIETVRSDTI